MTKLDFLNELHHHLLPLPKDERNEIIEDFRAHFAEAEAEGKTQEQICEELGSPIECAKQYLGDTVIFEAEEIPVEKEKFTKKHAKKFWTLAFIWNVIQAFVSIPVTLSIFLVTALMCVFFAFVVPVVESVAFLVFAIAITFAVFCLGVITLLWAIIEIKECIKMINK